MNHFKNRRREIDDKFNKYKKDFQNERMFLFKINQLFTDEFEEIFDDILILNESQFLSQLKSGVESNLEEMYSDKIFSEKKFSNIFEKGLTNIKSDYKVNYDILNNAFFFYSKNKNSKRNDTEFLINQYRRHCLNEVDNSHATHICNSKLGKFILVKKYGKNEFVICSNCKKVYYSNMILCKCYKCNKEYYTEILPKNEDEFLLPATWENYHCKQIANEKIKCIKCHENFFVNLKTGMLVCLNKKCNFTSKPLRILWTCSICQEDFKSKAIPYNPLDLEIIKKIIKQTLFLKQRAHPNKVPCCKINVFFTEFFHKKKCPGILYTGELNSDIIIVCDKCHAINFYDRFIWTCPNCGNKFKDEKEEKESSISEDLSDFTVNSFKTISTEGRKKVDSFLTDKDNSNIDEEYSSNSNISKNRPRFSGNSKNSYLSDKNEDNRKENKKDINKYKKNNNEENSIAKKNDINKYKINNNEKSEDSNEINSEKYSATIEQPRSFKKLYTSRFNRKNQVYEYNKAKDKDKNIEKEKKNEEKPEVEVEQPFTSKRFNRLRFYTEFDNKKKEREKEKEKEREKEKEIEREKEKEKENNTIKSSDDNEQKRKIEKAAYNVFARYRQKRRLEEKEKEEKEKEKEEKEKERKEKEKEKERKEKEERKLKEEKEEREKKEKKRKEREEKEKRELEEKEKLEKEMEEKEREEKERKENESKFTQSSKRIGYYKSFKRTFEKKENIEFPSSKGLQKVEKKEMPKKSSFLKEIKKKEQKEIMKKKEDLEEEEEIEEDDLKIKNRSDNKIEEENELKKEENTPSFRDRWKFRRPEAKKTLGKVIKEETESTSHSIDNNTNKINNNSNEENSNTNSHENNSHKSKNNNNQNNNNALINPITKIPGMSDNLLNHLNRRISSIVSKCTIPLMNVEDYILYRKIGEGSYGIIFSVISKKDKKQYALKKIISNKLKQIGEFTKEFELVHSCEHENIMKIYNFCIRILDPTTYALYVLMELSDGDWDKEIKKKLKQRKNYSEKELINILYQLTSALLYIQEKYHISHRDIKPQNVLVFSDGKYKLADFGEAKEAKVSRQINTLRGTELYMSPALYDGLKNEKNDVSHNPFKSDVFSLGFCFLYASALNFNLLYEIRDILDSRTINVILHKFLNKFYSEKLIQLLASMLEIDETKRYDFSTIKTYIEDNFSEMINNNN